MSGLFRADRGGLFSVSDIKSVQHVGRRPGRAEHYVIRRHSSEATLDVLTWDMVELLRRPVQLTPAEPGTKLIAVYVDNDEPFADTAPIIAWALCLDGVVRPVTAAGVRQGFNEHDSGSLCHHPDYVQMPDGGIYEYGYEAEPDRHETIAAVLAVEVRRSQRHEADRKEQEAARTAREEQHA